MMMRALLLSAFSLVCFSAVPAHAGFEWKPRPAAPKAAEPAPGPLMPAVPQDNVDNGDLEDTLFSMEPEPVPADAQIAAEVVPPAPVVIERNTSFMPPATTAPGIVPAPETVSKAEPAAPLRAPVMTEAEPITGVLPSVPAADYAVIEGFGADMPLAYALRQIVPAKYAFSFHQQVNEAALVSWEGGKPWNMVADEALKPLGLGIVVGEGVVRVLPFDAILPQQSPITSDAAARASMEVIPAPKGPVREVYINRNTGKSVTVDRSAGTAEDFSAAQPAAGSQHDVIEEAAPAAPRTEEKEVSFWSRLGLSSSGAATPGKTSHAVPPPPESAPAQEPAGVQPVSLTTGDTASADAGVLMETATVQRVMDPYDVRFWQAEKGDSLKNVLSTWSDTAGVELYWVSTEDYTLPAPIRLHGNYTDAVAQILSSYGDEMSRPQGRLHPNLPTGPSVLIIEAGQKQ